MVKQTIQMVLTLIGLLMTDAIIIAQVLVSPGSAITIKDGTNLYIGTNLVIKSNNTGSGYLVDQTQSDGVEITGNILIERYLTSEKWHNVAAPLNNANSSAFIGTDLIFYYNEAIIQNDWNFGWVWYTGDLQVMKGYDVFIPANDLIVEYHATGQQLLNTGAFSTGVTLTNSANGDIPEHKGWNLLGNPYPSPVDWLITEAWDKTDINDAKYIWDPVNNVYTIFLGGGSPIGLNGGTQYIPSNQGFWVQAIQSGTVQLNNSGRVGITTFTPDYYKKEPLDYKMLKIGVNGKVFRDETIIRFIEGNTDDFDVNFDATKLFSSEMMVPQLASQSKGNYLAINTFDKVTADMIVPLYFKTSNSEIYSFDISQNSTIDFSDSCYLWDSKEDLFMLIDKDFGYSFSYEISDSDNRFSILFNPSRSRLQNDYPPYVVYTDRSTIKFTSINGNESVADFIIYNMVGQYIVKGSIPPATSYSYDSGLPSGIYLLNILSDGRGSPYKIRILN